MLFGPAPVPVPRLVQTIISGFLACAPRAAQTSCVKHALEKLGSSLGYTVFAAAPQRARTPQAWVLDLVWWEPGRGTVFAAGCQWGNAGDIAQDFQKLMSLKAPLKLMVFGSRHAGAEREDVLLRSDVDAILQALGTYLIDYSQHVAGETFVLLERVEQDSTFRAYEFCVPADGKLAVKYADAKNLFRRVKVAVAAVT